MSQYKRIVSYLYQYLNGDKGQNIGYVRLEQKGRQCRVFVQMRAVGTSFVPEVWLFKQEPLCIEYISIGKMSAHPGNLQIKVVTSSDDVCSSGHPASDFDGAVIYINDKEYYATTWTNESIYIGEKVNMLNKDTKVQAEEKTGNNSKNNAEDIDKSSTINIKVNNKKSMVTDVKKDTKSTEENADENITGILIDNAKNNNAKNNNAKNNDTESNINVKNNGSTKSNSVIENNDSTGNNNTDKKETVDSAASTDISDKKKETAGAAKKDYDSNPEDNSVQNVPGNGAESSSPGNEDASDTPDISAQDISIQCTTEDNIKEKPASAEEKAAYVCSVCPFKDYDKKNEDFGCRILKSFPVMYPFRSGAIEESVRIEPKDIGCMPIRLWSFANNRFLLHGYYCYKHLIFARLHRGGYALGVPGVYSEQESKRAASFSFKEFQPIGPGKIMHGVFGYWFTEIHV